MHSRVLKSVIGVLALACVVLAPVALAAQDSAKKAQKTTVNDSPSKWDIFVGYSAFIPDAPATGPAYHAIDYGAIASVSRYFNKNVGITFEGDEHILNPEDGTAATTMQPQDDFSGAGAGIIYRIPTSKITPFFHGLIGTEQVGSFLQKDTWGLSFTAGGGFDLPTSLFNHHLAIRLVQGDYQYVHVSFPDSTGSTNFSANGRISAGLVFHVGTIAPPPAITLACSANPNSIFPGDPVTVTSVAGGLDPKLNAVYSFSGTGVTGNGATASVATGALAAGTYTVNCGVKEGKAGKEGLKPWEVASATATFTVKSFEAPTVSCSANPSTIKPGETSTITALGVSPQNRPLTYSYSTATGSVSGSGTTAVYSSTGAPTGVAGITCTVTDDKGQTGSGSTTVTITAPYVAPQPHTQALCSISFGTDKKRPTRVDNEAKACLDEVALDLQKQSDATAVVVGNSTAAEKVLPKHAKKHAKLEDFAGERAVNTKEYLVTEKGIDASRVSVATGAQDAKTVEDYLVPSGASFSADVQGTSPVDVTVVKPQARKPLAERHHAKKHAAAAAK